TTVKPYYQRGTLKETYDNIRTDLETALPLIDNSIYEIPKYHFNKAAAEAYAARFYLYTREYDKCLEHCNNAFGGADVDPSSFMNTYFQNTSNFYELADHGKFNQGTDKARNFLLIPTYSIALRRFGGRYAVIRDALNSTLHSSSPSWKEYVLTLKGGKGGSFTMHPCFMGCMYFSGKSEYGSFYVGNISEQFEYTNKIAGIGYCHVTRSEFTSEEVLLTRAEAKLFLGDINGAVADLSIWEKSRRDCMGTETLGDYFEDLTIDNIREFYVDSDPGYGIAKTINIDMICPSQWTLGGGEPTAVLQCIQHFRRIEMIHTGMRWFDIKRLGLEFDRKIGKDGKDHLGIFDERKAVQIPAEIVAAGICTALRSSNMPR
ncbi:MAG: RagB/SusD family nutrient uptake outer membrane protein, partial [Muribaculaceae bacterium]|nr:RagB/SusD family nutrient uptake outer membrane protein [Muribaculaceae bacterium]